MNIVLFHKHECELNQVTLTDYRAQHILSVIKPTLGDHLRVGEINGQVGTGEVIKLTNQSLTLRIRLLSNPPQAMPVTLVLALPRPQMLKRVVQTVATLGVKSLWLVASRRVEKSYWQSPELTPEKLNKHLMLGLEQAGDTVLPKIEQYPRTSEWQQTLPSLLSNTQGIIAHPSAGHHIKEYTANHHTTIFIGPEGGWLNHEVETLMQAGIRAYHIGPRILRVDTAVNAMLSQFL